MGNWPTEPPANNPLIIIDYYIYSRDPSDTVDLRAAYGGFSVARSPLYMLNALSIDDTKFGFTVDDADRVISFPYPPRVVSRAVGTGAWQAPIPVQGTIVYPPNPAFPGNGFWWPPLSVTYDYTQDWFLIPAHPSVLVWGPGVEATVMWNGIFLSMGGHLQDPDDPPTEAMQTKHFISGFELPHGGEGASFFTTPEGNFSGQAEHYCKDASRTPDGIGCAMRNSSVVIADHDMPGTGVSSSWERIYLRLRRAPTTGTIPTVFLQYVLTGGLFVISLRINGTGQIEIWTGTTFGTQALRGLFAFGENIWRRLDILLTLTNESPGPGTEAALEIFVDGAVAFSATALHLSAASNQRHTSNRLGGVAANNMELDIDDWFGATRPTLKTGFDFLFGSHCQLHGAKSFGTGHNGAAWTGNDYRTLMQNPVFAGQAELASSTSGARAELATDWDGNPDGPIALLRQVGVNAFIVGIASTRAGGAVTATLGWRIGSGGDVLAAITELTALDGNHKISNLMAGLTDIPELDTLEPVTTIYTKSTDVSTSTLKLMLVEALCLGSWGPEDDEDSDGPGLTDALGIHNGPFITSFLGREKPPPINTIAISGKTYVGNGTGQDVSIDMPAVHFLWIRHVTGAGGSFWLSSLLGPHDNFSDKTIAVNAAVRVKAEDDGTTTIQITGSNADSNQLGETYQVIAICDIMSRMMLNGAFRHIDATANDNTYFDPNFITEGMLIQRESLHSAGPVVACYWKGPGNAANNGSPLNAAETGNVATFTGAGEFQSRSTIQNVADCNTGYCALRHTDDSGVLYCAITSYVGDGTASRDIALALNGRRPMFGLVVPMNGAAYFRDPSHLTDTSSQASSFGIPTGTRIIGGGIDKIIVGLSLNTLGITYSVWVVPGGTDAGNGGWATNDTVMLGETGWDAPGFPDSPIYLPAPADIPADIAIVGEGGLTIGGSPGLTLLKDISGIYTIVPGKTDDTVYDRQTGQTSLDVKIPDPKVKTGFIP